MKQYEIRVYKTPDGKVPFQDWVENLKDETVKTLITARLGRAAAGNFGDWKPIKGKNTDGLCEMRIHYGQGFRVFYTIVGNEIVLLLAGTEKKAQGKVIKQATTYLADYNERVKP